MKLREIIIESAINPSLQATKRDDAIKEMMAALADAGAITTAQATNYARAIIKRENKGSTGFGHGVAVPHIKHDNIEKMTAAIAISPTGIDFNALDNEPVYSIFLLLSPKDKPEDHLDAMEAIFGNLSQEQFRRFLRQAKSTADVMTLLEEADAKTSVH